MIAFRQRDWPPCRLLPFTEATLAPLLAVALHLWVEPLYGHFSLWLLPTLIALRYGVPFGLCTLLLFLGGLIAVGVPWELFDWVSGIFLVLTAGWVGDAQLTRFEQERLRREIAEAQLQGAVAQLYIAQATAKSLQSHFLSQEATLLSAVEGWIKRVPQEEEDASLWNHLLHLALPLAQINICGLFRYAPDRLRFEPDPIAHHGPIGQLRHQDPLIVQLLEEPTLGYYFSVADLLEGKESTYLAVVPMRWRHELLGALVIRDMPARQLNERNLKLLYALLTTAAWALTVRDQDQERVWQTFSEMPLDFVSRLLLAVELRQIGLPSVLIAINLEEPPSSWQLRKLLEEQLTSPLMADWVLEGRLVRLLLLKSFHEAEREVEVLEAELGKRVVLEMVEVPAHRAQLSAALERIS